jgi:predicted RecB family nuclease
MTASNPDHPDAQAMADKLLRYNADDVLATRHLRQWLDDGTNGCGWSIQPVETLDELN